MEKSQRIFTHNDVKAFFEKHWVHGENLTGATYDLIQISLYPNIRPGAWQVRYEVVFHNNGREQRIPSSILIIQLDSGQLAIELPVYLPAGLPSPEEEDWNRQEASKRVDRRGLE